MLIYKKPITNKEHVIRNWSCWFINLIIKKPHRGDVISTVIYDRALDDYSLRLSVPAGSVIGRYDLIHRNFLMVKSTP